jgi:hypothetical protein
MAVNFLNAAQHTDAGANMTALAFLRDIPMDKTHTLDQMTGRFQGVRDGLPELVKNSKDQYMRRGVTDRRDRQVVVLVNIPKLSLGVLDFAGARPEDFAGWQTWSSRTASRAETSGDIEGGHGNGGKAFMVRGSTKSAHMDSCSDGRRTKMGFDNETPNRRYFPGYAIVGDEQVKDVAEPNARERLDEALGEFGFRFGDLPLAAQEAFSRRNAFTLVAISGVKDWAGRRRTTVVKAVREIPEMLASHAQAALTIETCDVWVLVGRKLLTSTPLERELPEPFQGFEDLQRIPVPPDLIDPRSGEMVSTGRGTEAEKFLHLRTSGKQLRMTEERKALNSIRVRNERNVVANWPVARLAPRAESAFVYGDLRVPDLVGEHLADSHRSELADTPLARALEDWVSDQIDLVAQQIQRALARETKSADQAKATQTLQEMRELMRDFLGSEETPLEEEQDGDGDDGPGGRKRTRKRDPRPQGAQVREIALEPGTERLAFAVGTTVPLVYRAYDLDSDGKRRAVPAANLTLESDKPGLVQLKGSGFLVGLAPGAATVWLRDPRTGVESNRITVETLTCSGVDILVPQELLRQGQRVRLRITFHTSFGPRDDLMVEGSVDEGDLGRLSRAGSFTAGLRSGEATLRVRYAGGRDEVASATIEIGTEVMPPSGRGGKGLDIPLILLCGEEAPGMEEYPREMRTHPGGEFHPTIIEEPHYGSVIWINPQSKESLRVRRARGGSSGIGSVASKSFMEFVSLKCFEILKRLRVRQELRDSSVTETEFTRQLAQAEIDCAAFVDAAYAVADGLYKGHGVET